MGDSEDKRRRIMLAAEQLFTSCRYHEITTDDIAREAKVGKGTLYRLFQDKDDLFFQTAAMGFAELCRLLEEPAERSDETCFRDELVQACRRIGDFFVQRRQLFRMMQSEEGRMPWCKGKVHEQWQQRRQTLVQAVAAILERGAAEGHLRRDLEPTALATVLLALLRTRWRELVDQQGTPRLDHDQVIDLFLHGATPPHPPPTPPPPPP
ncbi:MAG: TetR/AcrR family transcriptional regulator, partial [Phycisphaeraceae bacterium]